MLLPVLGEVVFDPSAIQVESNTSGVDVIVEQVKLTEPDGIEYFAVQNRGKRPVNVQNFDLRVLDLVTVKVDPEG